MGKGFKRAKLKHVIHARQLTCQRRVINASQFNLFFMGKQLIFLILLGFENNSIYCSRNQICKTSFIWNKHIKNTHLDQECYVMKSKKMPELQGTTESAIIRLIIPEHNILSLATAWSQELNYTHTNSENIPIPLWVYTV